MWTSAHALISFPQKNDSKTIYNNSFDVYNDFLCFRIVFLTFVSFYLSSSDTFLYWFLPYSLFVLFSVYFVFFTIFYYSHNIVLLFIYHLPYDNNNFFIYILLQIFTFLCKPEFVVIYIFKNFIFAYTPKMDSIIISFKRNDCNIIKTHILLY